MLGSLSVSLSLSISVFPSLSLNLVTGRRLGSSEADAGDNCSDVGTLVWLLIQKCSFHPYHLPDDNKLPCLQVPGTCRHRARGSQQPLTEVSNGILHPLTDRMRGPACLTLLAHKRKAQT